MRGGMTRSSPPLRRRALAGMALCGIWPGLARATEASFPRRPLTLVVPFAPGGSTDALGRAVAERLGVALGQTVLVDNRPGAGTALAAEFVARAVPDGHTLLLASTSTMVINPLLNPRLRYDAEHSFSGVSMLAEAPMVMLVPGHAPARTLREWVDATRATPGRLNFGSAGHGSSLHLVAELFAAQTGLQLVHVPFSGSQAALNALVGGDIHLYFDLLPSARPMLDAGRVRALAVTHAHRLAALPQVPTMAEAGVAGCEASAQFALVAPSATPASVIERLHAETVRVLSEPALLARFASLAMPLSASKPAEVHSRFSRERQRWAQLIHSRGIRVDS